MKAHPEHRDGFWVWGGSAGGAEVRFVGRGPAAPRQRVLARAGGVPRLPVAWLRQVHSDRVREAGVGECGEGDALWTDRPRLALAVATADCVPLVLAGGGLVAAVHAGWRGIVAGVVPATVATLDAAASQLAAWIGPAIGPCCYEVSDEVAAQVVEASTAAVARPSPAGGERPHLDLVAAVEHQLAGAGVERIERLACCTRCAGEWLWSYRREGTGAGRNLAFAWLSGETP